MLLVSSSSSLSWLARSFTIKEILWLNFSHRPLICSCRFFLQRSNYLQRCRRRRWCLWSLLVSHYSIVYSLHHHRLAVLSLTLRKLHRTRVGCWLEVVGGCWWKCNVVLSSLLVNWTLGNCENFRQTKLPSICHRRFCLSTSFDTEDWGEEGGRKVETKRKPTQTSCIKLSGLSTLSVSLSVTFTCIKLE